MDGELKDPELGKGPAPRRSLNSYMRQHSACALDPARRRSFHDAAADAGVLDGQHQHAHEHDHHEPRISHRTGVLLEARLDDLAHDHLAALAPPPEKRTSWRRALLVNSWVLLLAAGVLVITVVSSSRLHVSEPLQHAHAVNGAEPYLLPIAPGTIQYLYVVFVGAPWYGAGATTSSHGRRRLSAFELATSAGAGWASEAPPTAAAPLHPVEAAAHLRRLKSHRVLAAAFVESGEGDASSPAVMVTLMQRDPAAVAAGPAAVLSVVALAEAVVKPTQLGLVPVSQPRACRLKPGAASRCLLAFTSGDVEAAAYVPGRETFLVFHLEQPGQVAFDIHAKELGGLGPAKNWIALGILLLMLAGIASERVHRMYCAFMGAFAMMALLLWMDMVPSLETVTSWLDESTLGLLFGMMILVGQLKNTGLFEVLCAFTLKACKGRMWALSLMTVYLTAFVSAFLDNVTTMLLMGPVTIAMMQTCKRDPRPLLLAQVLFSNLGGTATMVGDPPNVIIGTALARHLGFVDFIINLAPGVLVACVPATALVLYMYRATLLGPIPAYEQCLEATSSYRITDWGLLAKAGYVTLAVVMGFLLHPVHHVDPAWFAIIGAVLLCIVVAPMEVEEVMHSVELDMLLFLAAQFVMVEAAAEIGLIDMIGGWLEAAIRAAPPQSRTLVAIEILLWVSAVVSGILDNIPYTITMVPVVELLASAGLGLNIQTLAWALAFGACFGGNATLIGASANIVTATMLDKSGHRCTFLEWLKIGVPLMLVTVAAANLYMLRFAF